MFKKKWSDTFYVSVFDDERIKSIMVVNKLCSPIWLFWNKQYCYKPIDDTQYNYKLLFNNGFILDGGYTIKYGINHEYAILINKHVHGLDDLNDYDIILKGEYKTPDDAWYNYFKKMVYNIIKI